MAVWGRGVGIIDAEQIVHEKRPIKSNERSTRPKPNTPLMLPQFARDAGTPRAQSMYRQAGPVVNTKHGGVFTPFFDQPGAAGVGGGSGSGCSEPGSSMVIVQ